MVIEWYSMRTVRNGTRKYLALAFTKFPCEKILMKYIYIYICYYILFFYNVFIPIRYGVYSEIFVVFGVFSTNFPN